MTKMHHECPKYLKIVENDQNAPKTTTTTLKTFKMTKYHWNLKNKQYTLETSKNDENTLKQSQNMLGSLDFWGILVGSSWFAHCLGF